MGTHQIDELPCKISADSDRREKSAQSTVFLYFRQKNYMNDESGVAYILLLTHFILLLFLTTIRILFEQRP